MVLLVAAPLPDIPFGGVALVTAIAFGIPLVLHFIPRLPLPSAVFEIIAGIIVGPALLNWVQVDLPIYILSLMGLGILLFIGGLEVDFGRLRGPLLRLVGGGFLLSLTIALGLSRVLQGLGMIGNSTLVGIILASTSLGIVLALIQDAGHADSDFGQLALAGASIGEFIPVILLSLLFGSAAGIEVQVLLLGLFVLLALAIGVSIQRAGRISRVSHFVQDLQDTTAQIGIRGMFLLLAALGATALHLGFSGILGAFIAGAIVRIVDRNGAILNPRERAKINAIGYGVFIPFFWITTGLQFDLDALLAHPTATARVPIFLFGLLLARGLPALLYRRLVGPRRALAIGFMQATSLSFVVVGASVGQTLGLLQSDTSAALVMAALLSAIIYPIAALLILKAEVIEQPAFEAPAEGN